MVGTSDVSPDAVVAIRALIDRCSDRFDTDDHDGYADCFADDAVFVMGDGRTILGHAQLREFAQTWHESNPGPVRHVNSEHEFQQDGSQVLGWCHVSVDFIDGASQEPVRFERWYHDRYADINGKWRIANRAVMNSREK